MEHSQPTTISRPRLRSPTNRSRVTNGRDLLPGVDGRSEAARRYHDLVSTVLADLGGGTLSEARMQLVRRFAACAVMAELMEAKLVSGAAIDIAEHAQLSSTLVRLVSRIGLDRVPKDITPATLSDYIAKRRAEAEEAEREEAEDADDACVDVLDSRETDP